MKKAKEEIIADLYSLRAGLSVISEKADEVRELEQKVKDIELDMEDRASLTRQGEKLEEDIEQKIFTVKGKIKQIDNILAKPYSKQENLRRLKELQNKVVDSASKGMSQAEIEALSRDVEIAEDSLNIKTIHVSRKYADFDIKTFLMWFFIWGPIATCIVMGIFMAIVSLSGLDVFNSTIGIILFVLFTVGPLIYFCIIFPIQSNKNKQKAYNKQYELDLQSAKADDLKRKESFNKELLSLEESLKKCKQQNEEQKLRTVEFEEQISQLKENTAVSVREKAEESKIIETALTKQYNNLMIPADWHNIDLIIFYLQTGRADDMKEALQLADRQRQTDTIVSEIRQANASICGEIRGGFRALGGAMAQCFNLLSSQINAQHNQMISALNSVADSQNKVVGAIDELREQGKELNTQLVSAAQLNNALQAKANATSDQLKSDLQYMQYKMGMRN